jgi:FemAB-related protein (PEP-CTERM system-associated)
VYLAARNADGTIRGVLPLARFRSLGGRQTLVSLPFLDAAGVLADGAEAEQALVEAAQALGLPLELRQRRPLAATPLAASSRVDLFLPLAGDPVARWHALPGKVRNQARKAQKHCELAPPDADAVASFHRLHCAGMRELGTPPHSERFLRAVVDAFGARARVLIALREGRPIGGLIAIRYAAAVTVPWASSPRADVSHCPNHLVYWEALRWGEETGAAEFDFGRSPVGGGTYGFKRGWGASDRPLYWLRLEPGGRASVAASSGDSALLERLGRVWSRLPPVVCDRLGPVLRRRIAS